MIERSYCVVVTMRSVINKLMQRNVDIVLNFVLREDKNYNDVKEN